MNVAIQITPVSIVVSILLDLMFVAVMLVTVWQLMVTPVTCWIVGYLRELKELCSNVMGLWINTGINNPKKQVNIGTS